MSSPRIRLAVSISPDVVYPPTFAQRHDAVVNELSNARIDSEVDNESHAAVAIGRFGRAVAWAARLRARLLKEPRGSIPRGRDPVAPDPTASADIERLRDAVEVLERRFADLESALVRILLRLEDIERMGDRQNALRSPVAQ